MSLTRDVKQALTGGGATALDSIDGDNLNNDDETHVYVGDVVYHYVLDATSGAAENSPYVIAPDTNPGNKRWILQNIWTDSALTNLLTNSQWMAASNSTLLEATSGAAPVLDGANAALVNNLLTNGGFDSDATSWSNTNSTLTSQGTGKTGNGLQATDDGAGAVAYQSVTTVIGKLYQVTGYYQKGTATSGYIRVGNSATNGDLYDSGAITDGAFTQYSGVFEATATTTYVSLGVVGADGGETNFYDSVTLYEVTPGFVAADNLCFDGWRKPSGLYVYREHNGSNTKAGSFYAAKTDNQGANQFLSYPLSLLESTIIHKVAGRTVTLGVWAKTSTGSHAQIGFNDSVTGQTFSGYHTGGGDYEWLELTTTVPSNATSFNLYLWGDQAAGVIYWSQPMLVFGSSIGEGNYSSPPGEIIWFEDEATSNMFGGSTLQSWSSDNGTLNLEADTNGKVGKGVKAVYIYGQVRDSASSGTEAMMHFGELINSTDVRGMAISASGIGNDVWKKAMGWVPCDENGDVRWQLWASGGDTFDTWELQIMAIQTR